MKKMFVLFISLVLIISFTSCTNDTNEEVDNEYNGRISNIVQLNQIDKIVAYHSNLSSVSPNEINDAESVQLFNELIDVELNYVVSSKLNNEFKNEMITKYGEHMEYVQLYNKDNIILKITLFSDQAVIIETNDQFYICTELSQLDYYNIIEIIY